MPIARNFNATALASFIRVRFGGSNTRRRFINGTGDIFARGDSFVGWPRKPHDCRALSVNEDLAEAIALAHDWAFAFWTLGEETRANA